MSDPSVIMKFGGTSVADAEAMTRVVNIVRRQWEWSFWQEGYPAIMITDTAPFRYPYYHTPLDTSDKMDFKKMARVVEGVRRVVESLAREP